MFINGRYRIKYSNWLRYVYLIEVKLRVRICIDEMARFKFISINFIIDR
ncbi:hypothetical protein BN172_4300002 [Clostridioides difficile T15]|nr:hypothetical protein BN172_4300002 [Clostridioides difficile T15]